MKDLIKINASTTFGSARWADHNDIRRAGLNTESVHPFLGVQPYNGAQGSGTLPVFANISGHQVTVAPTRTGKGRCHIIPNLLTWPYSAVVLDIKGENYDVTARQRSKLGKVLRFSPYHDGGHRWNPVEAIRVPEGTPNAEALEQENVAVMADLLVTPTPNSNDPFFELSATSMLRAFLMWVATTPELEPVDGRSWLPRERSMAEVRRLLSQTSNNFKASVCAMDDPMERRMVREMAGELDQHLASETQFAGVISQVLNQTEIWSYDRVQSATSATDFSFNELRQSPQTLYIVIPPEQLKKCRAVLRALVGWGVHTLCQSYEPKRHADAAPVLFVLDEFASLGRMDLIRDGMSYLAGYGIKLWLFLQDLAQLRMHYGDTWQTFMANAGVRTFFGVSDFDTAKYVSEMAGLSTVQNRTYGINASSSRAVGSSETSQHGSSRSSSGFFSPTTHGSNSSSSRGNSLTHTETAGVSESVTDVARALINPDEVMRLGVEWQIVLIQGLPPIKARKLAYDMHTPWNGLWDTWGGGRQLAFDPGAELSVTANISEPVLIERDKPR